MSEATADGAAPIVKRAGEWPLRPWLLGGLLGFAGLLIHLRTHDHVDVPWRSSAAAFVLFGRLP